MTEPVMAWTYEPRVREYRLSLRWAVAHRLYRLARWLEGWRFGLHRRHAESVWRLYDRLTRGPL